MSLQPTRARTVRFFGFFTLALLLGTLPYAAMAQAPLAAAQPQPTAVEPSPEPVGVFSEPRVIRRSIDFVTRKMGDGGSEKDGFYPEFSNLVTGSGWISAGPGYRHRLLGDRAIADASAAISWRGYKMAQGRFELTSLARNRVSIGSQLRWQDLTQITYFGVGGDTAEADRSEYRLKSTNVVGYTTIRARPWLSIIGRVGWLERPTLLEPAGKFKRGNPATQEVFPDDIAFTLARQPNFITSEAALSADTRDYRSHPSRGGLYRASLTNYSDRDAGGFSFQRYEVEGAQFLPVAGGKMVFALHGWFVGSDTAGGNMVPFYLLPSLGGHNTLRGYTDFRFHDRNLVLINAESRVALFPHIDTAVFLDAGNVAPRVADLNLDKVSYGVGFRVHSGRVTFARCEIAHGSEGWRFFVRTSDPLHLSRLSRRTAAIPFAP